jgi:hypothetical protein
MTDEPLALMASWPGRQSGKEATVYVSSVDLRRLDDWDGLEEFLGGTEVLTATLTSDLPEDEVTRLQAKLEGRQRPGPPGVPLVRVEPRVGRNDPCPCGSGKKYKRCCA